MNYFFHLNTEKGQHQAVLYYEDIQTGNEREFARDSKRPDEDFGIKEEKKEIYFVPVMKIQKTD